LEKRSEPAGNLFFDSFGIVRGDAFGFYPPAHVEFTKIIRPVIEKAWAQVK
jgi:hypothetical protein